jgi:hypothetical protein
MSLNILEPLEGYGLDLRSPGLDEVAYEYAKHWFGETKVSKVMSVLHRSEVTQDRMLADLMEYEREYTPSTVKDEPLFQMAVQSVIEQLVPKEKLIPLTLSAVEKHPDFPKDRSPGIPWTLKGYRKKKDCIEYPDARRVWHIKWSRIGRGKAETLPDVCLFFRAQIATLDKNKIRAVWGYPIDVLVEEGRFFYPYIEWMKQVKHNIPIAYQVEMATGGMQYIDQMVQRHKNCRFIVGDWSKFDKTIPGWLLITAFNILFK